MPKPGKQRCDLHKKMMFRSVQHAIPTLSATARKGGTARLYWDRNCQCYHITTMPKWEGK